MATFVLLHGAFRGGWAWARVRPLLAAQGHDVHTPTLREHHLDEYVTAIADLFDSYDLSDVVLAGHSQGGLLARAAAERVAPRLRALAYLDAPVPRHAETARALGEAAGLVGPATLPPVLDPLPVTPGAGLSPEDAGWINARLTPDMTGVGDDPVTLTDQDAAAVAQHYAFCAHTPGMFPSTTTRRRLDDAGVPYALLDAAHDAPVTAAPAVTEWLLSLLRAQ